MKELNCKLAIWRWPEAHSIDCYQDSLTEEHNIVIEFKESSIFINNWFTNSLDAIFKWLVPKLERWEMGSRQEGRTFVIACGHNQQFPSEAIDKNPPMAFCRAIEKLIK